MAVCDLADVHEESTSAHQSSFRRPRYNSHHVRLTAARRELPCIRSPANLVLLLATMEAVMLLSEATGPSDAVAANWFEDLPHATLQAMLEAGRETLEWRRILAKSGDNLVGEILRHEGPFYVLDHYPKGDVFDPESHAQWYYHAHDKKDRPGEHGHFHTFMRGGGMPEGIAPASLPDLAPKSDKQDLVCHLIAISMDRAGWPVGLFTTNRWVTGETWYAARDVSAMLDRFDVRMGKPSWPVNRWLTQMLVLFRPQIEALLRERDERMRVWQRDHPEVENIYEDRRLELTSQTPISVEAQGDALEKTLARG